VIAFAAETESLVEHASLKRAKKGVDAILANWVGTHLGFEQEDNQLLLIDAQGITDLGTARKTELAYRVWQALLATNTFPYSNGIG
jgi:phosphopantothenoylcysteine decarboxylase/phosphopantothenate--cysteine ligase